MRAAGSPHARTQAHAHSLPQLLSLRRRQRLSSSSLRSKSCARPGRARHLRLAAQRRSQQQPFAGGVQRATMSAVSSPAPPAADAEAQKRRAIMAIMLDTTLTEAEKARRRQALMMGSWASKAVDAEDNKPAGEAAGALFQQPAWPPCLKVKQGTSQTQSGARPGQRPSTCTCRSPRAATRRRTWTARSSARRGARTDAHFAFDLSCCSKVQKKPQAVPAAAGRCAGGGAKGKEDAGGGGGAVGSSAVPAAATVAKLDENLKCAICMDLCERPVTVRAYVHKR